MKPKLMLRDLFWLTMVCAMGCAWWLDKTQTRAELKNVESKMRKLQFSLAWDQARAEIEPPPRFRWERK